MRCLHNMKNSSLSRFARGCNRSRLVTLITVIEAETLVLPNSWVATESAGMSLLTFKLLLSIKTMDLGLVTVQKKSEVRSEFSKELRTCRNGWKGRPSTQWLLFELGMLSVVYLVETPGQSSGDPWSKLVECETVWIFKPSHMHLSVCFAKCLLTWAIVPVQVSAFSAPPPVSPQSPSPNRFRLENAEVLCFKPTCNRQFHGKEKLSSLLNPATRYKWTEGPNLKHRRLVNVNS